MRRFAITLVLAPVLATACINDRDTLAFEERNVDALNRITKEKYLRKKATAIQELALRAIAGRFERFPARYYQMRIERLEALPKLTAFEYDDLAVAYDRIGKVDKAISIILDSRKHRNSKEDEYRFHANYGTFLVHRWIANGHKDSDVGTLKESISEIEKALAIDPASHFGRERVQLALEKSWLPNGPEFKLESKEAMVGLAGIVMMWLAYELPDAYAHMAKTPLPGQASNTLLPVFARQRYFELVGKGVEPISAPEIRPSPATEDEKEDYRTLREDGDDVHQARLEYMSERFDRGEHPDTHSDFWSDWEEPAYPVLNRQSSLWSPAIWIPALFAIGGVALLAAGGVLVARRISSRQHRPSSF
jgi:hypothetical protein